MERNDSNIRKIDPLSKYPILADYKEKREVILQFFIEVLEMNIDGITKVKARIQQFENHILKKKALAESLYLEQLSNIPSGLI